MKRVLISLFMLAGATGFFGVALPQAASAIDAIDPDICQQARQNGNEVPDVCREADASDPNPIYGRDGILTVAINILSWIVGVAAVFAIIISGLKMILSNGDPGNITTARNALLYAVVGLLIAALAQLIVALILSRL